MDFLADGIFSVSEFVPETWMQPIDPDQIPKHRVKLASLPTPIHRLNAFTELGIEFYVKRDDLTSFDVSGNKSRKLEFLLADALVNGYDSVVTVGGLQSNHCRATVVAARQLGLEPYIVLRTKLPPESIDLEGLCLS